MATAEKLNYLLDTKNQIKNAITEKGVAISDTDTFRSYADKIRNIQTGGTTTSTDDWQPEPDWWDIEKIIEEDTEEYSQKIICLLTDELDDGGANSIVQGAEKYKLSDGQSKVTNYMDITNAFDKTKDKECSKGYKTRYIIYYNNSDFGSMLNLPDNAIYIIFSGVKFNSGCFSNKYYLQAVKFINNTECTSTNTGAWFNNCYNLRELLNWNTSNVTNMSNMFGNCHSLIEIPNLDTSNVTNMGSMFSGCYSLREVPSFDTSNVTNMNNMFNNCCSLRKVPNLNTSNVTNMGSMFSGCYSLKKADFNIIQKNTATASIFNTCRSLKKILSIDLGNNINLSGMFSNCISLIDIQSISNIKVNISFSSCSYLNHSTLLRILNALVDLTDKTTQTLTLGSTNLAKLTDEEKVIATNKNWTLA